MDIHKNIVCVYIAILFFIFIFYINYINTEGFDTDTNISYISAPIDLSKTSLKKYKRTWNNSPPPPPEIPEVLTIDSCDWLSYNARYALNYKTKKEVWDHWTTLGNKPTLGYWMDTIHSYTVIDTKTLTPIKWNALWLNKTEDVLTKTNDFSISFWLYINSSSTQTQYIFKITDQNSPDGCLCVALSQSSLFVHNFPSVCPTKTPFTVPIKRAVFCTFVFAGRVISMFQNGLKIVYDLNNKQYASMKTIGIETKHIVNNVEVGQALSMQTYAIKDFCIYDTSLGDEAVVYLYTDIKNKENVNNEAYKFFQNQIVPEAFDDGSTFLKKWTNFGRIETFENNVNLILPPEIKLDNGKTFDYYDYSVKALEKKVLDAKIYHTPESKTLYYYSFHAKKKEYMNITPNILFNEKGCTFAMWFSYANINPNWSCLFDFGNGKGQDNIKIAIVNKMLHFNVFHGGELKQSKHESNFKQSADDFYHIAWTMDSSGNEWKLYFNGNLEETSSDKLIPRTYIDIPESGTATLALAIKEGFACGTPPPPKKTQTDHYENGKGWFFNSKWLRSSKKSKTPKFSKKNQKISVPVGQDTQIYNDMGKTYMANNTKTVSVARFTKLTLYSDTNQKGDERLIEKCPDDKSLDPQIEDVSEFPFQSLKLEKMKSTERVQRKNQYIGRSNWEKHDYFTGNIGDFRIFGQVLNAEQIKNIYENPKQPRFL